MNIIKRLPLPLARHIYSYDDTYKRKFQAVICSFKNLNYEPYYFELTKYPKIYSKSYWGNFLLSKIHMYLKNRFNTKQMIHNRNLFVEQYNIVKYKKPRRNFENEIAHYRYTDHNEYYQDKDGNYLHVFSNHPCKDHMRLYDDYTIIYPLYAENQTTFIKHLPRLKPKRAKISHEYSR